MLNLHEPHGKRRISDETLNLHQPAISACGRGGPRTQDARGSIILQIAIRYGKSGDKGHLIARSRAVSSFCIATVVRCIAGRSRVKTGAGCPTVR